MDHVCFIPRVALIVTPYRFVTHACSGSATTCSTMCGGGQSGSAQYQGAQPQRLAKMI